MSTLAYDAFATPLTSPQALITFVVLCGFVLAGVGKALLWLDDHVLWPLSRKGKAARRPLTDEERERRETARIIAYTQAAARREMEGR